MTKPPLHALLDTNVVLDVILNRKPFVEEALAILAMGEAGALALSLSCDAISTVFHVVERNQDAQTAQRAILNLVSRVKLAPLDESVVMRGLSLSFADIEDALVAAVAESIGADLIITRNAKDFSTSPVTVMTPTEFLAYWRVQERP